eukprot:COSAG01_NODE_420_length_17275_cov_1005.226945_11_plen_127_part_01
MGATDKVALCQGVAAAYARRHGADCEPALEALVGAASATISIDKDRARAEFEPLLPRMEAALVRPPPSPSRHLPPGDRPGGSLCGGLAPGRRPGGGALSPARAGQGPTHKLVLRAKGNYGILLSTKF